MPLQLKSLSTSFRFTAGTDEWAVRFDGPYKALNYRIHKNGTMVVSGTMGKLGYSPSKKLAEKLIQKYHTSLLEILQ